MLLTAEERAVLAGDRGLALQQALRALVQFGEAMGADRLVPVHSAHLVIGSGLLLFPAYLRWLNRLVDEGAAVVVPCTVDPRPFEPGAARLAERLVFCRQAELERLLGALGCRPTFTCTPYYGGNRPQAGQAVAWAESSAVVYANSSLGARTNFVPALVDLACALLGHAPQYGLLRDEERRANCRVRLRVPGRPDPALVGYVLGEIAHDRVPLIEGLDASEAQLKDLGAAANVTGHLPLLHVAGVTPEAQAYGEAIVAPGAPALEITSEDLADARRQLSGDGRATHVVFGCPHLSLEQARQVARALDGRPVCVPTVVLCAEPVRAALADTPEATLLQQSGVTVASWCPIYLSETPGLVPRRLMSPSAKLVRHTGPLYADPDSCIAFALGED